MLGAMLSLLSLMTCVLSVQVEDAAAQLLTAVGTGARLQPTLLLADAFAQGRYDPALLQSLSEVVQRTTREDNLERSLHRWARRQWWGALIPEPYDFKLLV